MISIEQLLDSFVGDQMARKLQDNQRYADIHAFSCGYGSWQKDHKFVYCCIHPIVSFHLDLCLQNANNNHQQLTKVLVGVDIHRIQQLFKRKNSLINIFKALIEFSYKSDFRL